ncbi:sensor histidine kinase, partial [bacterium]|nr:sensor histidine kinase [bacterium]
IGIDTRYYEEIFKIFKRLHTQQEYGGGTGAGLAIVKRIIEEHNGRIWVESELGKGSKFYISLPKAVK